MADRYSLSKQGVERLRDISSRVSGGKTSSRPVATRRRNLPGGSPIKVLITSTISAASWNGATNKLTPASAPANSIKLLAPHTDADGTYTYDTTSGSGEIDAVSFFSTAITITSGNARFGYVQNGELIIADCTEITL